MPNPDSERYRLLSSWCDGSISDAEVEELNEMLRADAGFRQVYLAYMDQHALLSADQLSLAAPLMPRESIERDPGGRNVRDQEAPPLGPTGRRPGTRVQRAALRAAVILALLVPLVFAGITHWPRAGAPPIAHTVPQGSEPRPTDDPTQVSQPGGVAILTRAVDVLWENGATAPVVGSTLSKGTLRLRSGVLQLEFYGGAAVVVEGPAEFELTAINEMACTYGKLRAKVPPRAHGFRVHSPTVDLFDLGTEFGMQVVSGENAEVHVFDGKVELCETASRSGQPLRWELAEGHGVRIGKGGELTQLTAHSPAFMAQSELERLYVEGSRQRYSRWAASSRALREDARLITYFSFEGDPDSGSRVLKNESPDRALDGAIVGCEWVSGRWPAKGALEFKRPSDRVRIRVPGEFESLTLSAWVRIDAIEHRYNSLMLTDGFELGAPHWQIDGLGQIVLGIRNDPNDRFWRKDYSSPKIFTPERLGRWTHLATVYDPRAARVTHYVDGIAVWSEPIVHPRALRIGDAELGNWGVPATHDPMPVRNLCGRMDEFALFRAALGPEDVYALYEQGVAGP